MKMEINMGRAIEKDFDVDKGMNLNKDMDIRSDKVESVETVIDMNTDMSMCTKVHVDMALPVYLGRSRGKL